MSHKSLREFNLESITLEHNNCTYDGEFYKRISGTDMGTTFAATNKTLGMGYFKIFMIFMKLNGEVVRADS